ncbi:MAG: SOS response-associated peptidase family protein [Parasporobacterium sp.]|nr:SOS response-associated peptidase family protein [Parasporobacterium sp.]
MCTRYYIKKEDPVYVPIIRASERSPLYERFQADTGKTMITSGEIRPTDIVPVLASNKNGKLSAYPMRWGVHMADNRLLFNARSETAGIKPFFREDWERRRCIVPASFYYEWNHQGTGKKAAEKYSIHPSGSSITWLCGLYRFENDLPYFVILTRAPEGDLKNIHDRMPLILPEGLVKEWIRPETDPSILLNAALTDMVMERAE